MRISLSHSAVAAATLVLSVLPSAQAATMQVFGENAASLVDAMMHSGLTPTAAGPAHMQMQADRVGCVITGATGGQPACFLESRGTNIPLAPADAPGTWLALSKTGRVQGGAHSGQVSVEATSVVCDIYLDQSGPDGTVSTRVCTL